MLNLIPEEKHTLSDQDLVIVENSHENSSFTTINNNKEDKNLKAADKHKGETIEINNIKIEIAEQDKQ